MVQSRQSGICVSQPKKLEQRPVGARISFTGTPKVRTPVALRVLNLRVRIELPYTSDDLVAILHRRIAARRRLPQVELR